jgi:hypothetical protein
MSQPKLRKITLSIHDLLSLYLAEREHSTFICYMIRNKLHSEFSFGDRNISGIIQDSVKEFFGKYFEFSNSPSDADCTIPLWFVNFCFMNDAYGMGGFANAKNGTVLKFYKGGMNNGMDSIRLSLIQHIAECHPEAVMEINL